MPRKMDNRRAAGKIRGVLTFVLGTRPEAIKLHPLLVRAKQRGIATRVILTGQHPDLIAGTGIKADVPLRLPGTNDPTRYVEAVHAALLHVERPRGPVLVQGDTASAMAGALWAHGLGVPLVHIEAGLRSGDLRDPWPEEGFRLGIDRLATLRCCPTPGNQATLATEGLPDGNAVTGNTITDALRLRRAIRQPPRDLVLVTLHRRESFGEPLRAILRGLAHVAGETPLVAFGWPVHPNPHVHAALQQVPLPPNVRTRPPLPYGPFVTLLTHANAVLTDSGGISEETTTLGIPTVLARNRTERPEALTSGVCRLAGTTSDGIITALHWALDATVQPSPVFGDGHASDHVLDTLSNFLTPHRPIPVHL